MDFLQNDHLLLCDTKHLPRDTYYELKPSLETKKILALTTKNIDKFRKKILYAELPKTFQDAILIARFIAINYIWIDSFALSRTQQRFGKSSKESLHMRDIYSNSYCNIAASHACDGETVCFIDRRIEGPPLTINGPPPNDERLGYDRHTGHFRPGTYDCRDAKLGGKGVTKSVLLQRAWVFQERLLAPSVLHFIECKKSRACELYPNEDMELLRLRSLPWMLHDEFKAKIHSLLTAAWKVQPKDNESAFRRCLIGRITWMDVHGQKFPVCQLMRESDRLIAISGLTRQLEPLHKFRY